MSSLAEARPSGEDRGEERAENYFVKMNLNILFHLKWKYKLNC